jgi:hypothetical protein
MIDLRDNCLLQYKFNDDDLQPQVDDTSGNDNHGTLREGGPPGATEDHSVAGKVNKALEFDGTNDYIDLTSQVNLSGFWSLTVGVYLDDNSNKPCVICSKGHATQSYLWVSSAAGNVTIKFMNNSGSFVTWTTAGDSLPTFYQTWRLIKLISVSGGASLQLFVDNVYKGSKTLNTDFNIAKISDNTPTDGDRFKGRLDVLDIFGAQLLEAERDYLWNSGNWTERLFEKPIKVYRGQDCIIDYGTVVAEMDIDDTQVTISAQNLPPNTIWDYVRRQYSYCDIASDDSPVCTIVIDGDGEMAPNTPNPPVSLTIEKLAGAKLQLRWRYTPIGEEISPTGFKIYMDSGSGFDFGSSISTVQSLIRAADYKWTSGALTHGQLYRFIVRSYRSGAGESQNTDFVAATADSQGPLAITDLQASWEEI